MEQRWNRLAKLLATRVIVLRKRKVVFLRGEEGDRVVGCGGGIECGENTPRLVFEDRASD